MTLRWRSSGRGPSVVGYKHSALPRVTGEVRNGNNGAGKGRHDRLPTEEFSPATCASLCGLVMSSSYIHAFTQKALKIVIVFRVRSTYLF